MSLDYTGESARSAERFVEQALPPGALELERMQLLGVSAGAPRIDAARESSERAATELSAGEASAKRRLAPQHRDAVRNFFGGDGR